MDALPLDADLRYCRYHNKACSQYQYIQDAPAHRQCKYKRDHTDARDELSRQQKKEIEELNRAENHFFSSMSHEIRTPINTIVTDPSLVYFTALFSRLINICLMRISSPQSMLGIDAST